LEGGENCRKNIVGKLATTKSRNTDHIFKGDADWEGKLLVKESQGTQTEGTMARMRGENRRWEGVTQ